jgi:hypothetical protein
MDRDIRRITEDLNMLYAIICNIYFRATKKQ